MEGHVQLQRPSTMRRKSSAQNLLSSFKPVHGGAISPIVVPTTSQHASGTVSSATSLQFTAAITGGPTSVQREWDVPLQSLQADTVVSVGGIAVNGSPVQTQVANVEILRELIKKRIITLTYLRNVHEGRSHWFHTIMLSRNELDRSFSNTAMKNRTYRFAILGMSLAHSFDMKEPQDLLRSLLNALNEYEAGKDDGDRSKMRGLFRSTRPKRHVGTPDYSTSYSDVSETSYLIIPHVPFPLDYHQTLLSLLDVLSEVYNKISKILGPSPFPSNGSMMGPLGQLSPLPGVSYLFTNADAAPTGDGDGSLWGIAHANPSTPQIHGGAGNPPSQINAAMTDSVRQLDSRLRKLIATLLKELNDCARQGVRNELASLDPLLRNVANPDNYDFDA